jgi:hypothetical protein
MNRSLVAVAVVLMTMLTPTNALAWFGWLDSLTGPGPFWGLLFDVRAVCFGERVSSELARQARAADQLADPKTRDGDPRVVDAWRAAAAAWAAAFDEELPQPEDAQRAAITYRNYVRTQESRAALLGAAGVFFSACSPNIIRTSSIDVAVDIWQTFENKEEFAGGEAVRLTTAKVSYSLPLFRKTKYDVLDYSIGVGFYWLTSRGFVEPITGPFLEPARFYFHAPSRWQNETGLKKFLTYPVFSAAAVVFPEGFQDNVFRSPAQIASGPRQPGHGAEVQPSFAVFVNVFPKR